MVLELDSHTATMIRRRVDSGGYASDGDVVRAAMRLLEEHERTLQSLRAKIDVAWEEIERGEGIPYTPELYQEIRESARRRELAGHQPDPDVCP